MWRAWTALVEDLGQTCVASPIRLLIHLKDAVVEARAADPMVLSARQRAGYDAAYTRLIQLWEQANPLPPPTGLRSRHKQTSARNLLDRLITLRGAILAFLYDFDLPFARAASRSSLQTA